MEKQLVGAVLGAGAQGVAAAYDLARYGNAEKVLLCDVDVAKAVGGALRVNRLLGGNFAPVYPLAFDAGHPRLVRKMLAGTDVIIGAVSYKMNEEFTDAAIDIGAHYVDLGGNTDVVRKQHKRHLRAVVSNVSIVPDCGMGPGFNLSLAQAVGSILGEPTEIKVYCGGLPSYPQGTLRYSLFFSLDGLVNEYSGFADVLKDGREVKQATLEGKEFVNLGGSIGKLEAAYTSGGLSTAPATFKRLFPMLKSLEYKTLRYPGHWDIIRAWQQRGDLRAKLEQFLGTTIETVPDIGIIVVEGKDASGRSVKLSVVDRFDPLTGFTAMQRLTGFHASIIAILAANKKIPIGVVPVEEIEGAMVSQEMARRAIHCELDIIDR
jgi:lysine 6-dehydrogenase